MNQRDEQRVVEALQAFTGGLVVTEHDIIEAGARLQRNVKKPPSHRRRIALVAAAAAVVLVGGTLAFTALNDNERSAPPVDVPATPAETLIAALEADAYFELPSESGTAPTIEQLNGLWTMRPYGDVSIPLIVTGDGSFRLGIAQPGNVFSTSSISGHTWTRATPESGCPQTHRYTAALLPDGSLRLQIDQADVTCTILPGAEVWDPLAPGTPMADYLLAMAREASWQPVAESSLQEGLYVAPDTGHVLEVAVDGSYGYYDSLTEDQLVPADRGDLEPGPGTVTGTCTGGSFSGNLETAQIPGVEGLTFETTAMRITADRDGCASGVTADEVWVRVVDQVD